jgi:transcription elongation factor GreA
MPSERTALDLIRAAGLLADGPVAWSQPARSRNSGIFLVELPRGLEAAPIETRSIAAWLQRVPDLRLDGERPTQAELTARLGSFWLPNQRVLYVGRSNKSLNGRVGALYATELGHRRPHPGGYWLKTLQSLDQLRIWWADTDAPEEYEDAILSLFAESVPVADRGTLPAGQPVMPWAVLENATGEKRETGLTNAFIDPPEAGAGTTSSAGAGAKSASRSATGGRPSATSRTTATRTSTTRTTASRNGATSSRASGTRSTTSRAKASTSSSQVQETHLTADGLAALEAELEQLRTVRRPEVILRVKNARELGDLRENAEYQEARNEQSFLEGRIQAIENMLRSAVVIEKDHTGEVILGSHVLVEHDGEQMTFHIVGSTEADPANGKISNASPVGRALMGHRAGSTVVAELPGRSVDYRIVEVR